jgi:DNA-binding NarL/FixJ family response regulator
MTATVPSETTSVVIADDHPIVREGMQSLIRAMPGFEVVGEAEDGLQAIEVVLATRPHLVIMDLNMPKLDGIEATRQLVTALPTLGVLVVTMFDDDDSLFAALRAGARGYILKGSSHPDVVRAITGCARGDAVFGALIARRVLEYFDRAVARTTSEPFPQLTDRERTVLDLISRGSSNAAIAARLDIAPKTVRNYASNIFEKLHVTGRGEAIVKARDEGFGR